MQRTPSKRGGGRDKADRSSGSSRSKKSKSSNWLVLLLVCSVIFGFGLVGDAA